MKTVGSRPFVKWAGGKSSLLKQLDAFLPADFETWENVTYVEPFVGGGAMMFHMLQNHHNISRVVINDINPELIQCYKLIRNTPEKLIEELHTIASFYKGTPEEKKAVYYAYRDTYNKGDLSPLQKSAIFIFLNHTCFNGLYRVNNSGEFNVPYGKYKNPIFCNEDLIMEDSKLLNSIEVVLLNDDYQRIYNQLSTRYPNFIYLDPPYRPISNTSYFKEYSNSPFGDNQQVELKHFCDKLTQRNCTLMLSNSDSKNDDGSSFFEELYSNYNFQLIYAPRYINAFAKKRLKQTEVLIRNYE